MEPSERTPFKRLSLARRIAVAGSGVSLIAVLPEFPSLGYFGVSRAVLNVLHYATIWILVVSLPFAVGGAFAYRRQGAREAQERVALSDSTAPDGRDQP